MKMGMSMHVIGIPEREHFDKMIELKEKCDELKVTLPIEISKYFGIYHAETTECLEHEKLFQDVPHREWSNSYSNGFEVDVKDIPDTVETIRFYCAW
jgi:hypothetical protein